MVGAGRTYYYVEAGVVAALHAHARAARTGHEIGGRLLVRDRPGLPSLVYAFEAAENLSGQPGCFLCSGVFADLPEGVRAIRCHSHPNADATPSAEDIEATLARFENLTAVYAISYGTVEVWTVHDDGTAAPVATVVEGRRTWQRRPTSRPGRR